MLTKEQHPQVVGCRKEARGKQAYRRQGSSTRQQVQERYWAQRKQTPLSPPQAAPSNLLALWREGGLGIPAPRVELR